MNSVADGRGEDKRERQAKHFTKETVQPRRDARKPRVLLTVPGALLSWMRCRHARRFRRATVFVFSRSGGGECGCTVAAMVSSVVLAIGRDYGNEDTM